MAILKITQTKSRIGATERQGRNLDALGLHKMNRTVYHEDSPVILGIVEKVRHLVTIETVSARPEKKAPRKAAAKAVKQETPKAEGEVKKAHEAHEGEVKEAPKAAAPKSEAPKKAAAPKAAPKADAPKAPAKPKAPKKEAAE